jgi:hypothetical protein
MLKKSFATLVAAACLATTARAATATGIGAFPCAQWVSDEHEGAEATYQPDEPAIDEAWLSGFLSGYSASNVTSRDAVSEVDPDSAVAWVGNYCKDHPHDKIVDAAAALVKDLRSRSASH